MDRALYCRAALRGDGMSTAQRIVFDSNDLPAELDDAARLGHWRSLFEGSVNPLDVEYLPDRPFRSRLEITAFDRLILNRQSGTVSRLSRTRRHVARSPDTGFHFGIVRNGSDVHLAQCGREAVYAPGQALLLNGAEPAFANTPGELDFIGMMIERGPLLELVPDAEDLVVHAFDPRRPAMQLLTGYVDLIGQQGVGADGAVDGHIASTLIDLIALILGPDRDRAAIARSRGPRAARLARVVAEIRQSFARPDLSPHILARRLGISARYLQDLLSESGTTLTERVLELRLQKARGMLANPRNNHTNVSDIALACGFNEVSYFNRCFRRRFGASPTQYRGS